MPSVFPPVEAPTLAALATKLELDPDAGRRRPSTKYNRSIRPGTFDPAELDDCHTEGLDPPKSHWAVPIKTPPFYGYPLRPGITFTYMGVTVDEQAGIVMHDGRRSPNMFAAGEVMSGNILGRGYLAGFGLTIGAVFGRIAGKEAARSASALSLTLTRRSGSLRSATPAATARGTAPSGRRWSCGGRSPTPTSSISPISASTAGPATTPASSRRRTSSPSTSRKIFAELRTDTYQDYAWPRVFSQDGEGQRPRRRAS